MFGPSPFGTADGFTIAVIPDTQCYTSNGGAGQIGACGGPSSSNGMFLAQARHLAEERMRSRIVAVIGTGDIVNCANDPGQWANATEGWDIIDAAGIPYAPTIGNHDYDTWCTQGFSRPTVNYNTHFGFARFAGKPWYGGPPPGGTNENFFIRFSADSDDYLVMSIEHDPRAEVLDWAEHVIGTHPDAHVIIACNEFLEPDGQRMPAGQRVWDRLVEHHVNVMLVLDSHGRTARRSDVGALGHRVPQISQGYQFEPSAGQGYMRFLRVHPAEQQIDVLTYSPYLERMRTDAANAFAVTYGR